MINLLIINLDKALHYSISIPELDHLYSVARMASAMSNTRNLLFSYTFDDLPSIITYNELFSTDDELT